MNGNGNRDRVFFRIIVLLAVLMITFGIASVILAGVTEPSERVTFRVIGAFGSMFTGLVGLIVGYLTGRR